MTTTYRIYHDWNAEQRKMLKAHGIKPERGFSVIHIIENETNSNLLRLIDGWGAAIFYGTEYDKEDYEKSSLFAYGSVWNNGYPMPDNDNGYLKLTYDVSDYCHKCGAGAVQKAPFRLRKEPKWGNKWLFGLNWVFDEIFVRKELYDTLFKGLGIGHWPVWLYKKETPIENTLQLKIPHINIPLKLQDHPYEVCDVCKRKKYTPQLKGFFPSFSKSVPDLPIFKSREYFGSGGEARNQIFVSRELWNKLNELRIKADFSPVE